jgi:DNA-binding transcriptional ArsR family regulator
MSRGTTIIKDPEVAKLLADPTRREILHLLRHQEMSATDLAKALNRNHSSIVHHLNALLGAGLITVSREDKVRNMVQPYYRSVSQSYHVAYSLTEALSQDPDYSAFQEEFIDKLMMGLEEYGVDIPERRRAEAHKLLRTCYMREQKAHEDRLNRRRGGNEISPYTARNAAHILNNIQLLKDPEYMDAIRRLSELIDEHGEEGAA